MVGRLLSEHPAMRLALDAWGWPDSAGWRPSWGPDPRDSMRRDDVHDRWIGTDPQGALDALRDAHLAETRPDLDRVHPSWLLRALREETASVRAVLASHGPETLREAIAGETPNHLTPARPPHPGVLACVLALWDARIVGDVERREDDSIAVRLLTGPQRARTARLLVMTGLAQLASLLKTNGQSVDEDRLRTLDPKDRDRLLDLIERLDPAGSPVLPWVRADLGGVVDWSEKTLTALGLTAFGRRLATTDRRRARWALQHLPTSLATFLVQVISKTESLEARDALVAWEDGVLRAAEDRLEREARPS